MIDVHVPQRSEHTWIDFFIHIGTIAVGLLLAIGLEQGVEWLHHRHERQQLREDLRLEDEKALRDNAGYLQQSAEETAWLDRRLAAVQDAIRNQKPIAYMPAPIVATHSTPVDPVWNAAKASNLIEVLPQDDIKAYSEIDDLLTLFAQIFHDPAPGSALISFDRQFWVSPQLSALDFSSASHADLVEELRLLAAVRMQIAREHEFGLYIEGALQAVLAGERNLDRIDDAELKGYVEGSGVKGR